MHATDCLKLSLQMSREWIQGLIIDMKEAPLVRPTAQGGNHPLWILGHLVFSEVQLRECLLLGRANPLESWQPLFGQGSAPADDVGRYPSMDELLKQFDSVRKDTLTLIDSLSDEDLDRPSHAPEELRQSFGTVGQCLIAISLHFTFHGGQLADARRAAGRLPLMG
jgi:hypothetical protein